MPTVQVRNPELVELLRADFQARYEPNFAWVNAVGANLMVPGLRGFWPMSSWDQAFAVYDLSGQGRTLTNNNTVALDYENLAPKATFNGTTQYLSRADEAGLDILNIGLTVYGWFWANAHIVTNQTAAAKYVTTGNQRSFQMLFRRSGLGNDNSFAVSTDGINNVQIVTSTAYTPAAWHFLAGRWTPSTEVTIFANYSPGQALSKFTNAVGVPATIFNSTAPFTIGANGDPAEYLAGKSGFVAMCQKALSDAIINQIYQQSRALFGV